VWPNGTGTMHKEWSGGQKGSFLQCKQSMPWGRWESAAGWCACGEVEV